MFNFCFIEYIAYNNECLTCDGGFYEDDECKTCPLDSKFANGICACDGNATYVSAKNSCYSCPAGR